MPPTIVGYMPDAGGGICCCAGAVPLSAALRACAVSAITCDGAVFMGCRYCGCGIVGKLKELPGVNWGMIDCGAALI